MSPTSSCTEGLICCSTPALDLELPYCAKWLLLAAFLASRNSHATDRRLFDLTAKSRQRGGLPSTPQTCKLGLHVQQQLWRHRQVMCSLT